MSDPVVCSIGCTDPWNAAGVGLDISAIAECGAYAVTVVAGVTAQDASGVLAARAIDPALIAAQLRSLRDAGIGAYRIGALLDVATVEFLAEYLAGTDSTVVYDPVLGPSGGGTFANDAVRAALVERLVPIVTLVTPNLSEAAAFTGYDVRDRDTMETAARSLRSRGARAALVKGGHLAGPVLDVLVDESGTVVYEDERLPGSLRGTGCLLGASIAAALARGEPLREAIVAGRAFVRTKILHARERAGMRVAY